MPPVTATADRREQLLDAALQVFAQRGVDATRVEDVTAAAGVAKGTFYLYFRTKDELLAALRERFVARMLEMALEAAAQLDPDDPWELVDTYLAHVINFELDECEIYDLLIQEGGVSLDAEDRCVAVLTSALAAGARSGSFAVDDPEATARFLFHGVESLIRHHHRRGATDRAHLITVAQRLVRRTLEPR